MENLVLSSENGQPATTSLIVAEVFNKRHDHVLRDIDNLSCSKEFNLLNFGEIEYFDGKNRKQRAIEMTKDGFTFLVMGYSGPKAGYIKEKFINQFNRQQRIIEKLVSGQTPLMENLVATMKQLAESTNERFEKLEKGINGKKSIEKQEPAGIIDARHRSHGVVEHKGIQMRCIKLDDIEWYAMTDILTGIRCRTKPYQYAIALNRNGKVNAQKIWLFGQSREQWFVNEAGLNLLMTKQ